MRPFLASATALAGTFLLAGCAALTGTLLGLPPYGKTVTATQLIGTWNGGDCHSTLIVNSDQTFSATDFPTDADSNTITTRVSGTGTWRIVPATDDDHPATMELSITSKTLDFAKGSHGSLVLATTLGDPDEGIGCRFTHN